MKDPQETKNELLKLLDYDKIRGIQKSNGDTVLPDYVIKHQISELFDEIQDSTECFLNNWKLEYDDYNDNYILSYTPYILII